MGSEGQQSGARIFLAIPAYQTRPADCDGNDEGCCAPPDEVLPYRRYEAYVDKCFTECWKTALNTRDRCNWTDFAMLHTDVKVLAPGWLSILAAERRRVGADLLSVVLPIKTHHGNTSTAVLDADGNLRRLTQHELWNEVEAVTFDAEAAGFPGCRLLNSTGLWIADFSQPWVEEVWFETHCRLVREGDKFAVAHWPEDWGFSKMLHDRGLKVMATKILEAEHWGMAPYGNSRPWGTVKHDPWHPGCSWLADAKEREVTQCP